MKLYATVTSERASKSQGGNDYLEIDIRIIDRIEPKYYLRVNRNTVELLDSEERVLFIEEHTKGVVDKGEKQKGIKCQRTHCKNSVEETGDECRGCYENHL